MKPISERNPEEFRLFYLNWQMSPTLSTEFAGFSRIGFADSVGEISDSPDPGYNIRSANVAKYVLEDCQTKSWPPNTV
jgi:hypothetical protein